MAELDFYAKVQAFNCNNRDCVSEEAFLEGVGKVVWSVTYSFEGGERLCFAEMKKGEGPVWDKIAMVGAN